MTLNNLRPDLVINQVFTPVTPVVPAASLPVLLIGLNRRFAFKEATSLTDWNAGTASNGIEFPGWLGGTVESITATDTVLRPHIYVRGSYGTAEIEDVTYHLGTVPPTFDVAAGADATFSMTTGTSGVFAVDSSSPVVGTFSDSAADFIADQVGAGDVIYVGGVPTYRVDTNGLVSDDELIVRRVDKGPQTAGATETTKFVLMPEDTNGVRQLIATSDSFAEADGFTGTGVRINDLVRLDNWEVNIGGAGLIYSSTGKNAGTLSGSHVILATERTITHPAGPGATYVPWNNSTYSGTVFFLLNDSNDLVPMFYASTSPASATQFVKNYAQATLPTTYQESDGAVYHMRRYAVVSSPETTGVFTVEDVNGDRTFTDASANFSSVIAGNHIAIKDTEGIYRPIFNIASPGATSLRVTAFSADLVPAAYGASNVDYVILSPSAGVSYLGATVGATATDILLSGPAPTIDGVALAGDERLFTAGGADFGSDNVSLGDLIFTDAGVLGFVVTQLASPAGEVTKMGVRLHEYSGLVLDDGDTMSNVGYTLRNAGVRADFKVRRIVDSETLEVVELSTTPNEIPAATMVKGAVYFQTPTTASVSAVTEDGDDPALVIAPDSSASISYEIKKTLSGANLEGDVLITYAEVRNDDLTMLEVDSSTYEDELGDAVPGNPLGLAAQLATQNTPTSVFALRVETDDVAGWQAALDVAKVGTVYSIVPLTSDASILSLARTHVSTESSSANKRERILYQSAAFPTSVVRTSLESGDVATINRNGAGVQTLVIDRDVTTDGVIVGDNVVATAFNGTEEIDFSGRITNITSAGGTTMTMLPDGNIALSTSGLTVVAMVISSKTLSNAELRDSIADYAENIVSRRVRNVYPDNVTVNFTDSTGSTASEGIYGGGEVTRYATGGFYMCAIEAAKRARFGPVKPLTKTGGPGINTIVDPFEGNTPYQDTIIDAGTYYMEQPNGEGSDVQAIRALTTDATDLVFVEDSVTTQIDNFARQLRAQIRPLLGPYTLDEAFFTLLSAQQSAVCKNILDNREMKTIQLDGISTDTLNPDTFLMNYTVQPFFSAARGEITIYI